MALAWLTGISPRSSAAAVSGSRVLSSRARVTRLSA